MQRYRNLHYDTPDRCKLDIFVPPRVRATVMLIHGGAWFMGDQNVSEHMATQLAAHDILVFAPTYRLSPISNDTVKKIVTLVVVVLSSLAITTTSAHQCLLVAMLLLVTVAVTTYSVVHTRQIYYHPSHIQDVAKAFAYVHRTAPQFGSIQSGVVVMGHSAGGHLASLLACNPEYLWAEKLINTQTITKVVSIAGVFSDTRMQRTRLGLNILHNSFGHSGVYFDAFPIYHTQPDTPPHLILNADIDYSLKRHSFDMCHALRSAGVFAQHVVYRNTDHFSIRKHWDGKNRRILQDIVQFIYS